MDASKAKVWVLAGQSNMEGCGYMRETASPDPRVLSFSSAGAWELAEEPLHWLWESYTPVHQKLMRAGDISWAGGKSDEELALESRKDRSNGSGLGLAFGTAMAEATGETIGLIPCAHGGTSLDQWSPALAPDQGTGCLYGAMLDRIERAGGELAGVLWYQGESDCDTTLAASYDERFAAWVAAVRCDTGHPDLPVIVVQLGRIVPGANSRPADALAWDAVRDVLAGLSTRIPGVGVVGAIDLGLTDLIHISTPSLIRLGRRMAAVALHMKDGVAYPSAISPVSVAVAPQAPSAAWSGHSCVAVRMRGVTGILEPSERMQGFAALGADGLPHPTAYVIEALRDFDDPTAVRVILNAAPDATVWIGYGRGFNPACNVTDSTDMGLLSFSIPVNL